LPPLREAAAPLVATLGQWLAKGLNNRQKGKTCEAVRAGQILKGCARHLLGKKNVTD